MMEKDDCKPGIKIYIWRILLACFVAGLFSVSGWALSEVHKVPGTYETKEQHEHDIDQLYDRIDQFYDRIDQLHVDLDRRMDELAIDIKTHQDRTESKIDETNKFLRNYFSQY